MCPVEFSTTAGVYVSATPAFPSSLLTIAIQIRDRDSLFRVFPHCYLTRSRDSLFRITVVVSSNQPCTHCQIYAVVRFLYLTVKSILISIVFFHKSNYRDSIQKSPIPLQAIVTQYCFCQRTIDRFKTSPSACDSLSLFQFSLARPTLDSCSSILPTSLPCSSDTKM